ncbi:MAG TPA: quinone-dependent dihydroorotate dehydrogenase, partial [Anaerolineales bacterium]|nr:quinone-dependent dihydroorotate dehydrogenase [Anaerolineales bacterium]
PFFRSLLFRLDPETAHHLTLQLMRLGGLEPIHSLLRLIFSASPKPVDAFGLTFKNPIGLAAGYDKDAVAIVGLSALGFGHIEIGTVTPQPQPGNPRPRVFRLPEEEAVINRMGFPSLGLEFVKKQLNPALRENALQKFTGLSVLPRKKKSQTIKKGDVILGINLGKNKDTPNEEAVLDYLELLQGLAPYADYLAINVSSPNTVGLRQLQGRLALEGLLTQLHAQRQFEEKKLNKRLPLLVKLAPDLSENELHEAVDVILGTHMDGVIVTNTTLAREGLGSKHRDESGGLSGSPLRLRSETVLCQVVKRVDGKVPIMSAGGIMNPEDAKRRLELGATLIQLYTGLIYQGPGLVKKMMVEQ